MHPLARAELRRFVVWLGLGFIAGSLLASWPLGLLAAAGFILGRYLFYLHRFSLWLDEPDLARMPALVGPFGSIGRRLLRNQERQLAHRQRLSEQLQQFKASAAALPDGAVSLGPGWEIRWINDAAQRLLGLHAVQDVGRPLTDLYRSPELAHYLRTGAFDTPLELSARLPQSELRLSIRVIRYGTGQWLLLAQDISERCRLERVRKDFVANVSHELRTPLTVLAGFVENLQHDSSGCGERWARPLSLMAQQAGRMQRIVEDLLLLARLEGGRGQDRRSERPVDVGYLAAEIRQDALSTRSDAPRIQLAIESSALLIGDEQQLRSAFANLVINAVNYTPADGEITLVWQIVGDAGCFAVQDTGEGIAPEHIPRLTERFYRVDTGRSRQRGGTGLGLAIVKHVLQSHGGELAIESQPGQGSRFVCTFPASRIVQDDTDIDDVAAG